jgi:chaperonin GroEL
MILVCDTEISNILQIEQILKPIISEGKKLLIIAPCGKNMLNTLSANVVRGNIKCCAVQPPNFGYRQHELMQDIALSVGATYFSEKTGDDLSTINFGDLGHAAKVVVGSDKTVIIRSDTKVNSEDISKRISELSHAYEKATKKSDKDFILERIASLTGGVGVIYVGGNTDLEQKELYDRVDDAVCAVRSALEEGILPGAGRALASLQLREICGEPLSKEQAAAMNIMQLSIKAPMVQILENSGLKPEQLYTDNTNWDCGYDVKTGTMGNLIDMGVVDPLKVTRSALQNAISVAVTILSTNAIVTMSRQYPHDDTQGYPM